MRCLVALLLVPGVLAAQTPRPGAKGAIVFNLKETAYAAMAKRGQPLTLEMKLSAPPERYRLRTVLREDATNRITASSQTIKLKAPPQAGER